MDDAYFTSDMGFHVNLMKAAQNNLLCTMASAYIPILKEMVITSSHRDYNIERRYHYHRKIFDCILAKDGEKAAEMTKLHHVLNRDNFVEFMNAVHPEPIKRFPMEKSPKPKQ